MLDFLGSQDMMPHGWVCAGPPGPHEPPGTNSSITHSGLLLLVSLTPKFPPGCLGAPVPPAAQVPLTSAGFGAAQCPPPEQQVPALLPCGFPPSRGVQEVGFAAVSLCQGVWSDSWHTCGSPRRAGIAGVWWEAHREPQWFILISASKKANVERAERHPH